MFGGDDCVLFKDKEWKIEMSFPRRWESTLGIKTQKQMDSPIKSGMTINNL
jgi:hypothetical protein